MGNFSGLSLNLPEISDIENFDFSKKLTQINNLLMAEQIPNGERFIRITGYLFCLEDARVLS